jgi:hypothetical protein
MLCFSKVKRISPDVPRGPRARQSTDVEAARGHTWLRRGESPGLWPPPGEDPGATGAGPGWPLALASGPLVGSQPQKQPSCHSASAAASGLVAPPSEERRWPGAIAAASALTRPPGD